MANNGNFKPSNFVLPAGVTIGGYYLGKQLIEGNSEEKRKRHEEEIRTIAEAIEYEVENAGQIPDSELESHRVKYKAESKAVNENLRSSRVDIDSIEQELKGEPLDVKSLRWKEVALRLHEAKVAEVSNTGGFQNTMDNLTETFPWLDEIVHMVTMGAGLALIYRILDFGKGGGGLPDLPNWREWIENGLAGAKDVLHDIDVPTEDIPEDEWPTGEASDPKPTPPYEPVLEVAGSIRAAARELNLKEQLVLQLIRSVPVAGTTIIVLESGALTAIRDALGVSMTWLVNNPARTIIIAVALVVAAGLAIADGPLPVGDAAAATMLATVGGAIGVSMPTVEDAKIAAPKIHL